MSNTFRQNAEKWEALSVRERVLILFTVTILPLVLIYIWLIEPALINIKKIPPQVSVLEMGIASQTRVLNLLKGQKAIDPNIAARAELKRLRLELTDANEDIRRAATNLVTPDQMLAMLRDVLDNGQSISLISARSLSVETMQLGGGQENADNTTGESLSNTPTATIYIHPFEIVLEGTYQGLYDYLQRIEQLDGVFFWDSLDYSVGEHPTAKVKIKVHTLSSEAGWLGA